MGLFNFLFGQKKPADEVVDKLHKTIFPGGQRDIDHVTNAVMVVAAGKLTREQARSVGIGLKTIAYISSDRSEERLLLHLAPKTPTLTESERKDLIKAVIGSSPRVLGSDGRSPDRPIVLLHKNSIEGIDAEYRTLENFFGPQNKEWRLLRRNHGRRGSRYVESFVIEKKDGEVVTVYFDITSFAPA